MGGDGAVIPTNDLFERRLNQSGNVILPRERELAAYWTPSTSTALTAQQLSERRLMGTPLSILRATVTPAIAQQHLTNVFASGIYTAWV